MKFEILDAHAHAHAHAHELSSTKYQYLDELLDRTFITEYFLDRSSKGATNATIPETTDKV